MTVASFIITRLIKYLSLGLGHSLTRQITTQALLLASFLQWPWYHSFRANPFMPNRETPSVKREREGLQRTGCYEPLRVSLSFKSEVYHPSLGATGIFLFVTGRIRYKPPGTPQFDRWSLWIVRGLLLFLLSHCSYHRVPIWYPTIASYSYNIWPQINNSIGGPFVVDSKTNCFYIITFIAQKRCGCA